MMMGVGAAGIIKLILDSYVKFTCEGKWKSVDRT